MNLSPVFVRLLAPADDPDLVSAFVASLIVARVPVFLFQAAQAALVPRLSHHAGGGRTAALRSETRGLVVALAGLTVVAAAGAALLGPAVVRIGWGPDFALDGADMAILAAASCIYLMGVTYASALIARERPDRVTAGWAVGVAVLLAVVALAGPDTLGRVEWGFFAGAVAAALAMGLLAHGPLAGADVEPGARAGPRSGEHAPVASPPTGPATCRSAVPRGECERAKRNTRRSGVRVLILGGDGYLGWPTAMHFSRQGDDVCIIDDFTRRRGHLERGTDSLTPIASMQERVDAWAQIIGRPDRVARARHL